VLFSLRTGAGRAESERAKRAANFATVQFIRPTSQRAGLCAAPQMPRLALPSLSPPSAKTLSCPSPAAEKPPLCAPVRRAKVSCLLCAACVSPCAN
jgi:hypothetical protein